MLRTFATNGNNSAIDRVLKPDIQEEVATDTQEEDATDTQEEDATDTQEEDATDTQEEDTNDTQGEDAPEIEDDEINSNGKEKFLRQLLLENDVDGILEFIEENWPINIHNIKTHIHEFQPIQLDCLPDKVAKRRYKGPANMVPGTQHGDIWEAIHQFPSVARLNVFILAIEHIKHYVSQYEEMNTNIEDVKRNTNRLSSNARTFKDFLEMEAVALLSDPMRGPITYMFIAGALKCQLNIHELNRDTRSFPACPCNIDGDSNQAVWIDRRERVYGLSPEILWSGRDTNLRVSTFTSDVKRVAQLPGVGDGVWLRAYGVDVWKGEVERVRGQCWIDDNIVNVMLRHKKEESGRNDIFIIDSNFVRTRMVPEKCANLRTKLPLSAFNKEKANRFISNLRVNAKEMLLIPICDKYFKPLLTVPREFKVSYPNVQRQSNGYDCGLFVIYYGSDLIQNRIPDWINLGCG